MPDTVKIAPGHFLTLSDEEEWKLKEVWAHFLRFWGTPVVLPSGDETRPTPSTITSKASKEEKPKKKLFSKFRRGHKSTKSSDKISLTSTRSRESIEGSYTHKAIHDALKDLKPEDIYQNFWGFLRSDTPDNLILRFLRARKWDSDKALAMLSATLHWRLKESHVDALVLAGDKQFVDNDEQGVLKQLEANKAHLRGVDHEGRPIVHIRPRLHFPSAQTLEDVEKYTIFVIEEARLYLREPVDSCSILFDLTDFSMSNMDYAPVKFMIAIFEAHYPESLGKLFIHKAPWIFPPIWNIVKNWLDPVVAAKITFTKNTKDLQTYIDDKYIPKSLGGEDNVEPTFTPPREEDDVLLKDTETRDAIQKERKEIIDKFIKATVQWIEAASVEESKRFKQEKQDLGLALAQNYVKLDPYIRSRNNYDRQNLYTVQVPQY